MGHELQDVGGEEGEDVLAIEGLVCDGKSPPSGKFAKMSGMVSGLMDFRDLPVFAKLHLIPVPLAPVEQVTMASERHHFPATPLRLPPLPSSWRYLPQPSPLRPSSHPPPFISL